MEEKKKSQILFTMKKRIIFFHPGWETRRGVGVSLFCFPFWFSPLLWFFSCLQCMEHGRGHLGTGRTGEGADGGLRWAFEGLSRGWEGRG